MIYGVDFDGTLCEHKFPEIGKPNMELINKLREKKVNGDKLILITCRGYEYLADAVKWCNEFGLYFDAVNDDLQEIKNTFVQKSIKVYADVYLDDRNKLIEDFLREE